MEPAQLRQQTPQKSEGRAEDTFLLPLGSPTPSTCYNCQHAGSTRLCLNSELAHSCGPLLWVHFCTRSTSSPPHTPLRFWSTQRHLLTYPAAGQPADLPALICHVHLRPRLVASLSPRSCERVFFKPLNITFKKNIPVYLRFGIWVRLVRFYYWISTDIMVSICCSSESERAGKTVQEKIN